MFKTTFSKRVFNKEVFPDRTAFTGAIYPYWSPKGDAVLVMWDDYQSMSSLYKNKTFPHGGPTSRKWKYGRFRSSVTVHALKPRKPTSLEPPKASTHTSMKKGRRNDGHHNSAKRGKDKELRVKERAKGSSSSDGVAQNRSLGCSCQTDSSGRKAPPLMLLLLLFGLSCFAFFQSLLSSPSLARGIRESNFPFRVLKTSLGQFAK